MPVSEPARGQVLCSVRCRPRRRRAAAHYSSAAGLTAALFIITPILLVSSIDPAESDLAFGLPYIAAFLLITFLMAVYTVGTVIVSAVVRRRNRSTARGILVGVGAGLLLGAASCTASFAVF